MFVTYGDTVTTVTCCTQMLRQLCKKQPSFVKGKDLLLVGDNAKPHVAIITEQKLSDLVGCEVLQHPPYSSDISPANYQMFMHRSHFLKGRLFKNKDSVESALRLLQMETFFFTESAVLISFQNSVIL